VEKQMFGAFYAVFLTWEPGKATKIAWFRDRLPETRAVRSRFRMPSEQAASASWVRRGIMS
jgi:hypothetical protein